MSYWITNAESSAKAEELKKKKKKQARKNRSTG